MPVEGTRYFIKYHFLIHTSQIFISMFERRLCKLKFEMMVKISFKRIIKKQFPLELRNEPKNKFH